mmetsp:Transcript_53174/g.99717  ORF Transcript_53174/g.99717 Transcript_53174/m.99717 type:complete len:242 (-) Transcript_53174:581-1306(-)
MHCEPPAEPRRMLQQLPKRCWHLVVLRTPGFSDPELVILEVKHDILLQEPGDPKDGVLHLGVRSESVAHDVVRKPLAEVARWSPGNLLPFASHSKPHHDGREVRLTDRARELPAVRMALQPLRLALVREQAVRVDARDEVGIEHLREVGEGGPGVNHSLPEVVRVRRYQTIFQFHTGRLKHVVAGALQRHPRHASNVVLAVVSSHRQDPAPKGQADREKPGVHVALVSEEVVKDVRRGIEL